MKHLLFTYICLIIFKVSQHSNKHFRLPTNVEPEYYELNINATLEEGNFYQTSIVKIYMRCVNPTNRITLHSRNLIIKQIQLYNLENSYIVNVTSYTLGKYDFLYIDLADELKYDERYKLTIKFRGEIGTEKSGFYRTSYIDNKGEEKWIASTSFEPTNARAAFPCFDEPAWKSIFSIKLIHESHLVGLSNMPRKSYSHLFKQTFNKSTQKTKNYSFEVFQNTSKMSTYLVAYMVSDFEFHMVSKSNKYGDTRLKIWAPKHSLAKVTYATEVSPIILGFFEEYFNVAYPIAKLDLVPIPELPLPATESWGLTIFRYTNLMYVSDQASEGDKYAITKNIVHNMAHYWFGNLVTIKWWKYFWFKEGFAAYLIRLAIENLFPKWKSYSMKTFLQNLNDVYDIDGLRYSTPISKPIKDPHRIYEIYDSINYSKGACMIRMLEHFLGANIIKKGFTNYLDKYIYSSTGEAEFWSALSTVAHDDNVLSKNLIVGIIMNSWTHYAGFPLVSVLRDYTKGTVTVTQRRYFDVMRRNDESCYWIPLTFTTEKENDFNNTKPKLWLQCPKTGIKFEFKHTESWILFNINAAGFYRVNYDEANWNLLIKQLHTDHKKISFLNRILLIEDVVELAMTDKIDFKITFNLLRYLKNENSHYVWQVALQKLNKIRDFLFSFPEKQLIEKYINAQIIPKYNSLGGINSNKQFTKFDQHIIETACLLGNQDCVQGAAKTFQKWLKNDKEHDISEYILETVLCYGLKVGDEDSWTIMWRKYLKSKGATKRNMMLHALGCTQHQPLLNRYLNKILIKDSGIKQQDADKVFKSVINNEAGFKTARKFFYENIQDIYYNMSPPGSEMIHFLPLVAKSLKTHADRLEFKEFTKTNSKYFHKAVSTLNQMLEKSIVWEQWHEVTYPKLTKVLKGILLK